MQDYAIGTKMGIAEFTRRKRCTECGRTNPKTVRLPGLLIHAASGCGGRVVQEG